MREHGCWRVTTPKRERDRRAHWFATYRDHRSICGLVQADENGIVKRDIVAVADVGVLTCAVCRHMLTAQEELRDLARRRRRDAD